MPLMYPIKHVFRNWKLFAALLIGITLAATFCAAIGIKANMSAQQSLDKQLSNVLTDIQFSADLNQTNLGLAYNNLTNVDGVKKVDMVARFNLPVSVPSDNFSRPIFTQMACFPKSSQIYDEWENKPVDGIPENYTYLIAGTTLAQGVQIGDNITTMLEFPTPKYWNSSIVYVNFTVAGFATLTDTGYSLLTGNGGYFVYSTVSSRVSAQAFGSPYSGYRGDLMIASWDTLEKLWNYTLDSSTVNINFNINVDRQSLINPWNIAASSDNVNRIAAVIRNEVQANYLTHGYVNNILGNTLSGFQSTFTQTLFSLISVSIPVFFVAWYLGSTVSDVSFNIRRREIGLLSTKGLSSGQIQSMFLTEALVIGLLGGFFGLVGGLILNQYYAGTVDLNNLFVSRMFSIEMMAVTLIFGVVLAFFSVFWSSRRAARMPAVEALRDYMPIENKSRWRFLPWIALIFGSYKIIVFALGINMQQVFFNLSYSQGNFFLYLLSGPVLLFDSIMTVFGPILFFWGFTKVLIRDSTKFQTVASKISSITGDLGALAAKNVRRNPARLAAIAFLIAFIIGYSVQVNGQIASQQDYTFRQVKFQVGADLTVDIVNATKAELILGDISANVSGIRNASIQRSLSAPLSDNYGTIQVRTIDVDSWNAAAYYESDWFSGTSVDQMLKEMKANNNTIILERNVAKQLGKELYDEVGIDFPSCIRKLRIIGFFGPEPIDRQQVIMGGVDVKYSPSSFSLPYYSYVPRDLFNMTFGSDAYSLEPFTTRILVSLNFEANGTEVANQIRQLNPNEIFGVDSFDEQWRQTNEMNNLATYGSLQILDIQGLGLVFAVLSASVGTALIAVVSLKERSREATLMSVRGLSYRQLVWMFLSESMAVITFSVIIGIIVGVIIVYGSITSANASAYMAQLITQRLIYPVDSLTTIAAYIGLIYASTIGAILVMTSQYVTKLEKMVRAR